MRAKETSNYLFMLSGVLEAVKVLGIMWVYEFFWAEDFYRLSFNIDLISAFGALLSPWLVAYLQKSRESARTAYIVVVGCVVPLSCIVAFVYYLSANYFLVDFQNSIKCFYGFIVLRAISIVVVTFTALNYSVLAQAGKGLHVFFFQLCSILVTLALYYIFSDYGLFSSLISAGFILLLFELFVANVTFNTAKTYLSIASLAESVRKVNYIGHFKPYSRIVLPETGTVLSVVISTFLLSSAAYVCLREDYEIYRLPLAFMTANWIVANKVTTLLVSFGKNSTVVCSLDDFKYTVKYTWYIPIVLLLVYIFLFSSDITSAVFLNVALVTLYFPGMAVVIAIGGALRAQNRNAILLKANIAMLCFYFVPVVTMVYLNVVGAGSLIHIVGISYLARILVIKIITVFDVKKAMVNL